MSGSAARARIRRAGAMGPRRETIALPEVRVRRLGVRDFGLAGIVFALATGVLSLVVLLHDVVPLDEMVTIVDAPAPEPPPPPPPPKEEPPPPPKETEPKPVPPDPDQPPPQPTPEPPPPQFGLPPEGTSANGDMAVATGNSLLARADTVVRKAPPPLAAAPISSSYDAQVIKEVVPAYPSWAEEQGVQAVVEVVVSLDDKGQVTDVKFLRSGGRDFDESVRRSIRASRFKPVVVSGRPVPSRFVKRYNFEL